MKTLALILCSALSLVGCATTQSTQVAYVQACSGYAAAFSAAVVLRANGKLSQKDIDAITLMDTTVTPLCTGPLPTDPTLATQQVTAAVTTLLLLEAAQKAGK
jgi:hypothetical protein